MTKKKMLRRRKEDHFAMLQRDTEQFLHLPFKTNEPSFFWRMLDVWVLLCICCSLYLLYIYSPILENIKNSRELLTEQSCYTHTPAKWVESCAEAKRVIDMTIAEHISDHVRGTVKDLSTRLLGEGIVSVVFFMVIIVTIILSYTFLYAVRTYTNMELTRTAIMYASRSIQRKFRR